MERIKVFETFYNYLILRIPGFLGHCWDSLIFIVNCNNNNTLISTCWKYAINNANSPVGYITLHILEIVTVLIFFLMYVFTVKKVTHPP